MCDAVEVRDRFSNRINSRRSYDPIDSIDSIVDESNDYEFNEFARTLRHTIPSINVSKRQRFQTILDLDQTIPDKRIIHWFCDSEGEYDRNELIDYMSNCLNKRWITINSTIQVELKRDWKRHGIIVNLDRKSTEWLSLYKSVKNLKNSYCCHVVIFSSRLPVMRSINLENWRIYLVGKSECRLIDSDEINEMIAEDWRA